VHQLHGADTPLIGLFQALELPFEEVEAFDVHDDGRLPQLVSGRHIGHGEGPAYAMMGHKLVDPRQPIEVYIPKQARLGGAQRCQHVLRVTTQEGAVGHIGQTEHGETTRAHAAAEVGAGAGQARREAMRARVGVHVDRDVVA
jgi:hypothetical protein